MRFSWGYNFLGKPNHIIKLENNYFEKISDTDKVWKIFDEVRKSTEKNIELNFSECTSISNTGLTILAALGPLCNQNNKEISLDVGNNSEWIDSLIDNSILEKENTKKKKTIPFRLINDENTINGVLRDLRFIEDIKNLSVPFFSEIYSKLYELCANACEHGKNNIGAVCNGSCNKQYFTFTVFDFGIGIVKKVNTYFDNKLSSREALEWAFKYSNSTLQDLSLPRGAGFTLIFDFIQKYKGQLIIYTNNMYYSFKNGKAYFKELDFFVPGTLITITISIT